MKESKYYRSAFQGFRGVTLGGLLYSTMFNMAFDAVVRHWFKVMVEGAYDHIRRGKE